MIIYLQYYCRISLNLECMTNCLESCTINLSDSNAVKAKIFYSLRSLNVFIILGIVQCLSDVIPDWLHFFAISAVRGVEFNEPHTLSSKKIHNQINLKVSRRKILPSDRTSRNLSLNSSTLELNTFVHDAMTEKRSCENLSFNIKQFFT